MPSLKRLLFLLSLILMTACSMIQVSPVLPVVTVEPSTAVPETAQRTAPAPLEPSATPLPTQTNEPATAEPAAPTVPPADGLVPNGAQTRLNRGSIHKMALSPDGKQVAVATKISVCLYELPGFAERWCAIPNAGAAQVLAFHPKGGRLAAALNDGNLLLLETATGARQALVPIHPGSPLTSVAWSPDGKELATAGRAGWVEVWDTETWEKQREFALPIEISALVAWSPDGDQLAVGVYYGPVMVLDAQSGEALARWSIPRAFFVTALAWTPNGEKVVTGSSYLACYAVCNPNDNGAVTVWDTGEGEVIAEVYTKARVNALSISRDGKSLAVGLNGYESRVYRLETLKQTKKLAGWGGGMAWLAGGRQVITSNGADSLMLWEPDGGEQTPVQLSEANGTQAGYGALYAPAWSPDGSLLATFSPTRGVVLWDGKTGQPLRDLGEGGPVAPIAWSPGGQWIATIYRNRVLTWDVQTGARVSTLRAGDDDLSMAAWSPDGGSLAAVSLRGELFVWDVQAKKLARNVAVDPSDSRLAWSPDGKTLATAGKGIRLWDASTGEPLGAIGDQTAANSLAWSADGARLFAASGGWAMVWDAQTGEPLSKRGGHPWGIENMAVSPDETLLATAAGEILLRDLQTGEIVQRLPGHREAVDRLAFSPDGQTLASASQDGTVILWEVQGRRGGEPPRTP